MPGTARRKRRNKRAADSNPAGSDSDLELVPVAAVPVRPRRATAGVPAKRLGEEEVELPSSSDHIASASTCSGSEDQIQADRPRLSKAKRAGQAIAELTEEDKRRISSAAGEHRKQQTKANYATHERKFKHWCNHDITGKKRARPYADDLTGPDAVNKATLFLEWEGQGCPGYKCRRQSEKLGSSQLAHAHSMLQHMFRTDCLSREDGSPVVADLKQHPQYKLVHDTLKAKVHSKKGERPTNGADPHDGTIEDTMTQDQYLHMARTMLGSADRDDARDLAVMLWMMMCAGRGDDARLMFLPDLMAPKILKGIGPALCFLIYFVEQGGKTQKGGRKQYTGCIRHRLPALCAIGALVRWLVARFTEGSEPFADPRNYKAWQLMALWTLLGDPTQNVSYETMRKRFSAIFKDMDILCRKVTHALRVLATRVGDEAGLSDQSIARLGRWTRTAMHVAYLQFFKPDSLLAMGDWPGAAQQKFDNYWSERFTVQVPLSLIHLVMPWLPQLEERVAEVGAAATGSMVTMPKTLSVLAEVGIQDALELAEEYPNNAMHAILLKSSEFLDLLQRYKQHKRAGTFEYYRPLSPGQKVVRGFTDLSMKLDNLADLLRSGVGPYSAQQAQQLQQQAAGTPRLTGPSMETLLQQQRCDVDRLAEAAASMPAGDSDDEEDGALLLRKAGITLPAEALAGGVAPLAAQQQHEEHGCQATGPLQLQLPMLASAHTGDAAKQQQKQGQDAQMHDHRGTRQVPQQQGQLLSDGVQTMAVVEPPADDDPATPSNKLQLQHDIEVMTTGKRHQRQWFTGADGFDEQLRQQQDHEQEQQRHFWQQQRTQQHAMLSWQQEALRRPHQLLTGQAQQLPMPTGMLQAPLTAHQMALPVQSLQPSQQPFGILAPHTLSHPSTANTFPPVPDLNAPPQWGLGIEGSMHSSSMVPYSYALQLAVQLASSMAQQGAAALGAPTHQQLPSVQHQQQQHQHTSMHDSKAINQPGNYKVPTLGQLQSVAGALQWYTDYKLPCGATPQQLEERGTSWRQGFKRNGKRFSEIKQLIAAVRAQAAGSSGKRQPLTTDGTTAAAMDAERVSDRMSLPKYYDSKFVARAPRRRKEQQQQQTRDSGSSSSSSSDSEPPTAAGARAAAAARVPEQLQASKQEQPRSRAAAAHARKGGSAGVARAADGAVPEQQMLGHKPRRTAPGGKGGAHGGNEPPNAAIGGSAALRMAPAPVRRGPPLHTGGRSTAVLRGQVTPTQSSGEENAGDCDDFDLEEDLRSTRRRR